MKPAGRKPRIVLTRDQMLVLLRRREGNVRALAHELCMSRRHLYRLLSRDSLWPEVDRLRVEARERRRRLKVEPWTK